jgi:hypothetical protein
MASHNGLVACLNDTVHPPEISGVVQTFPVVAKLQ